MKNSTRRQMREYSFERQAFRDAGSGGAGGPAGISTVTRIVKR
jgi:hypothetical protein